jgi:vacuolar-type H+-ATPase subunit H
MNGDFFGFGGMPAAAMPPRQTTSEIERLLQGLLDELPDQARTLVAKVSDQIAKFDEQTETAKQQVRKQAEQQVSEIERKADSRRRVLFDQAVEQLQPLQKELFGTGDLSGALAVFLQIRSLKARAENVQPDPGDLTQHQQMGKTFLFRVTGRGDGPVWGSDIYTADSFLATAAVHAGALEVGEEGVVRVSVVSMADIPIRGSLSNGIMSRDWGFYPIGYRVEKRESA